MSDELRRPLVSVVIPSHRPEFRREAEASVDAQTFELREMVVRGSPLWWREKLNETIAAASGKYVVLLCDDDLMQPTFLAETVAKAEEGYDIVYTDCGTFGPYATGTATFSTFTRDRFIRAVPCWITTLFRKELWEKVGGLDMDQIYYDKAFWYECYKADAAAAYIPRTLWRHREHGQHGPSGIDRAEAERRFLAKYPELTP